MKKIAKNKKLIYLIVVLVVAIASGVFGLDNFDEVFEVELFSGTKNQENSFEVHYIDVGQGACSLIICDGDTMLIDAGENGHETEVLNYLSECCEKYPVR